MSCYFRHLNEVFAAAGIAVTPANRKLVDAALHRITGVPYKSCPAVWKILKHDLLAHEKQRQALVARLKKELG